MRAHEVTGAKQRNRPAPGSIEYRAWALGEWVGIVQFLGTRRSGGFVLGRLPWGSELGV